MYTDYIENAVIKMEDGKYKIDFHDHITEVKIHSIMYFRSESEAIEFLIDRGFEEIA